MVSVVTGGFWAAQECGSKESQTRLTVIVPYRAGTEGAPPIRDGRRHRVGHADMHFGLSAATEDPTWERLLAVWREADQIPLFESAWTFDHLYLYPERLTPVSRGQPSRIRQWRSGARALLSRVRHARKKPGPCLDGWMSLAGLLQATTRIRGGCLVSGMVYRHPAVLANMATTLDIISNGRLELGLGTGWSEAECQANGIELGNWRERFDRFDEGVACLVGLLSQPVTDFEGRYFHLSGARCDPKGIQQPHPPITIGGSGEHRTIPAVARWAQQWHPGFDLTSLPHKREVLAQECARVGRDPAEIKVLMTTYWSGRSKSWLADEVAKMMARDVDIILLSLDRNDPRLVERAAEALSFGAAT